MKIPLSQLQIVPGDPIKSGHTVHRAIDQETQKKIIYKENKHHKAINSHLEVSFSGLAECFLMPGTTAKQHLVVNDQQEVIGVASENIAYAIADVKISPVLQEHPIHWFATIDKQGNSIEGKECQDATDLIDKKVVGFFNEYQPGLLSKLYAMSLEQNPAIQFNMESLASVLTTSYTLEEDDLHKGNFGFYLMYKDGVQEVNFIKIDHDLMLVDSVMSRGDARFANLAYTDNAFDITARDLAHFPILKDSGNHYWPARFAFLSDYKSSKAYTIDEIATISKFTRDPKFVHAKWLSFYKHILITEDQIRSAVSEGFEQDLTASPEAKSEADAYINLITNAVVARQSRLKSVLFSMKPFRDFVLNLSETVKHDLIHEVAGDSDDRARAVRAADRQYRQRCAPSSRLFTAGDTPLHTAIVLGNYRYDETYRHHRSWINTMNDHNRTPLDLAIEALIQFERETPERQAEIRQNVQKNPEFMVYDLLERGAKANLYGARAVDVKRRMKNQQWPSFCSASPYLSESSQMHSREGMLDLFAKIGADCQLSLKMKKQLSLACLESYIEANQSPAYRDNFIYDLRLLKIDLNGYKKTPPHPAMQYIRQLRSELWIVRQIRGLLGGSATQVKMVKLLDTAKSNLTKSSCFANFFTKASAPVTPAPVTPAPVTPVSETSSSEPVVDKMDGSSAPIRDEENVTKRPD